MTCDKKCKIINQNNEEIIQEKIEEMIEIITEEKKEECSICLSMFNKNDMCLTNCDHFFCYECLFKWFDTLKYECPLCRTNIESYKIKSENHKLIFINKSRVRREIIYRRHDDVDVILMSKMKYISFNVISVLSFLFGATNLYLMVQFC